MKAPILALFLVLLATTAQAKVFNVTLIDDCFIFDFGCNWDALFGSDKPGSQDTVIINATASATLKNFFINIEEELEIGALQIISAVEKDVIAAVNIAEGAIVKVAGEFIVAANSTLNVVGQVIAKGETKLHGFINITASGGLTISGSGELDFDAHIHVGGKAFVLLADAPHAIYGAITAVEGGIVRFANSTVNLVGNFTSTAAGRIRLEATHLIADAKAVINGTIELAEHAYVSGSAELASFGSFIVTGVNTTIASAKAELLEIKNELVVDAKGALTLVGNVIAHDLAVINGTITAAIDSAINTATTIRFRAGLALDVSASFFINASVSVITHAEVDIKGAVHIAAHAIFRAENATVRIAHLLAKDLNATVLAVAGALVRLENQVEVKAEAALNLAGQIIVDAATVAYGGVSIGVNFTAVVDGHTIVSFNGKVQIGGQFVVQALARAVFAADAYINSTVHLLEHGALEVRAGVAHFAQDLSIAGQFVVGSTVNITSTAGHYLQTTGQLLLVGGKLTAKKITVGLETAANAILTGFGELIASIEIYGGIEISFLTVAGDYTLFGSANTSLHIRSAANYSQIVVAGAAKIAGRAVVTVDPSFHPAIGTEFNYLTFGSATGDFNKITSSAGTFASVKKDKSVAFTYNSQTPSDGSSSSASQVAISALFAVVAAFAML